VADVIKASQSGINADCDDDEEPDEDDTEANTQVSTSFSTVSQRMIEQFFTEVEGPDRDWQDYDAYEDDDRAELMMES
jgi:hypothetical protein